MNRIDRLVAIVLFLQGRRVTRAEDLADHFEISVRTVYRDLAALGEAGVPIVAEAGVGYALMRGYHLPPVTFTREEAGALATAGVLASKITDEKFRRAMLSAILKVRAVLPPADQARLERVECTTHLCQPAPGSSAVSIIDLQWALTERRVVQIRYRAGRSGEVTERAIEPLGLVHYLANWHLISWCQLREDVRDFRVDRIEEAEVTREGFSPRFDQPIEDLVADLMREAVSEEVRVFFKDAALERARRDWGGGVIAESPREGGAILTLVAVSLESVIGWILSFQLDAEVVSPPELAERVLGAARAVAERG